VIPVTLVLTAVISSAVAAEVADKCFEQLPFGCSVVKSEAISGNQMEAVGERLGVPLSKLSNTDLIVQGKPIRVNLLEARTDADADRLYKTISKMKTNAAFCLLDGRTVVEFSRAHDAATAIKAAYELGFVQKPKRVTYRITANVAAVRTADYMAFNELSQAFFATDWQDPSQESRRRIESLVRGFTFGDSVTMRGLKETDAGSSYRFTPEPIKSATQANDSVVYAFRQLPRVLGVPYVTIQATISCGDTGLTPTDRVLDDSLLSATPYWPADDPGVLALAKRITAGCDTVDTRVQAILEWLTPGRNLKTAGPPGSRWGVPRVLKQKFGHCWDSSDCFVALSRAAGIPTRQVGGWLYGTSGHIWAEVLMDGKGWQQVDPTGGGRLDCGIYHIPYFTTETGEMPILYVSLPQVEIDRAAEKKTR
jgi:hypothetical protein